MGLFDKEDEIIVKVFNPLNATKDSLLEFSIGELKDTGIHRLKKIIEFDFGDRKYSRYLLYSKLEEAEHVDEKDSQHVLEVFPQSGGKLETYLYSLSDTIPFSEDFLDVVGQLYLTTPAGDEYIRCINPGFEGRIDGIAGTARVYDIEAARIEKTVPITLWDYQREADGLTQFLNVEWWKETGIFRIFTGEVIEDIFYRFFQNIK